MKQNIMLSKIRTNCQWTKLHFEIFYLENACVGDLTLVGAAKLNQISLIVNFMLHESGGGGIRGRSFFKSSDSTPSSYIKKKKDNNLNMY